MATIEAEEVLTQDRSTGMLHRRLRIPGYSELLTFEADNLDRAGDYDFVTESVVASHPRKCRRCFPTD